VDGLEVGIISTESISLSVAAEEGPGPVANRKTLARDASLALVSVATAFR